MTAVQHLHGRYIGLQIGAGAARILRRLDAKPRHVERGQEHEGQQRRDPTKLRLAAGRMLARHEAEPGLPDGGRIGIVMGL
jgi:hypothetical protein